MSATVADAPVAALSEPRERALREVAKYRPTRSSRP
jgi:hypothetical protein